MSRIHGRSGRIYFGLASSGDATPIAFASKWSISAQTDTADVTAFGDANKVYVAGLPDASGDFSGYYDDATVQTYTAATDGVARKFYLYPDLSSTGKYWFGTVIADFKADGDVGGAVAFSASWKAASAIAKVG